MLRRPPLPVERLLHQPEHPLLAAGLLGQGVALVAGLQAPPVDEVALARPGVVLVAAHRPDQADERRSRREHLDHPRAALDLAVHALLDVVRPHPVPVLPGEGEVGEGRGRGVLEELGAAPVHGGEQVDGAAVAGPHERRVRLGEGGLERRDGGRPVAPPAAALQHVALEVRDAALPGGAGQGLADGPGEALVGVRDDEAHAREPAGPERQQEAAPGEVGLGVDALYAHDAPARRARACHRGDERHRPRRAGLAARHVGGVEPQVRPLLGGEVRCVSSSRFEQNGQ